MLCLYVGQGHDPGALMGKTDAHIDKHTHTRLTYEHTIRTYIIATVPVHCGGGQNLISGQDREKICHHIESIFVLQFTVFLRN